MGGGGGLSRQKQTKQVFQVRWRYVTTATRALRMRIELMEPVDTDGSY
jgi:hypothetical protein